MTYFTRNQKRIGLFVDQFIEKTRSLLVDCRNESSKEKRIIIGLEIYKIINRDLDEIILAEGVKKWIKFVCVVADKIYDLVTQYRIGEFQEIDKKLVETFMDEINRAKIFTLNIIKNYNQAAWSDMVLKTKERFADFEYERPRRNIKQVDYTGMDTIEPENEFDGITNIWYDTTIREDPDYEYEDEDEDLDYEYEYECEYEDDDKKKKTN